jgi:GMP synthase (glutamine-hydrolysing)
VRILALVHQRTAGPGVFAEAVRARGAELESWCVPEGGPAPGDPRDYDAVLSFGGAMHPDQEAVHPWMAEERALLGRLVAAGRPVLGVCLGAQLLACASGGEVGALRRPEVGWHEVSLLGPAQDDPVLAPLAPGFRALEWHSYEFALPPGAVALARSSACLQAFRVGARAWGIQFHAEVTLADVEAWIDADRSAAERARLGFEAESLRGVVRASIAGWNRLGRDLCGRFLTVAGRAGAGRATRE